MTIIPSKVAVCKCSSGQYPGKSCQSDRKITVTKLLFNEMAGCY